MGESDFFNGLIMFDDVYDEDFEKYPKYCLLLVKPFANVRRIDLFKNEDFIKCITHLQKYHPDRYFTDSARFKIDLTQSGEYHGIIRQMNYLFFVEFEVKNNTVYITVYLLNVKYSRYQEHQEVYTVELKQKRSLVRERAVKHKGMEYIYTLEFKVSDLSIIGDITQTEVFISIENYFTCPICQELSNYSGSQLIFRIRLRKPKPYKGSRRCSKCTTTTIRCNMVFTYCRAMDYLPKIKKHTHFFCPDQYMCYVCHKTFYEPSFHVHYQKDHQDITYQIGDGIRIQATPGRYCLLRWSSNTFLLMRYYLDNEELCLAIRSPWISYMLEEYICSVTVSTPDQTETFQLCPFLYEYDDWRLTVGKWIFKKWSIDTEFTVVVDIQKIARENNSEDENVLDN